MEQHEEEVHVKDVAASDTKAAVSTSDRLKEIAARREAYKVEVEEKEKNMLRGRWVTDNKALRRGDIRHREMHSRAAPHRAARANLMMLEDAATGLQTENEEVMDRITQREIQEGVDIQTATKKFELVLDKLGPYTIDYTRNGTHLGLLGLRGHFATVRWQDFSLLGETQLRDACTDIKFLVDHTMIAVAQKRFVYVYTTEGAEMHILPKLANVDRLEYLSKHMLLAGTSSQYSVLQYFDVSTGKSVAQKTPEVMRDPACSLTSNPCNGVVVTGDIRGTVKFWAPAVESPLVQIRAHKGAIYDIAFHPSGRYFASLGVDRRMKIFDCRTLRALDEYPVTYTFSTMCVSQSGLLAMGGGTNIQVWKDLFTRSRPHGPIIKHSLGYGAIAHRVRFCPFEDVLGVGHSKGFSSILVPGSGEPNPDYYNANPYETERHRKERVVVNLLDKLPPETISMDLQIANVDAQKLEEYAKNLRAARKAKHIREKRRKPATTSQGDSAPSGLHTKFNEDEVDEELGVAESGPIKHLKTRKEKAAERKKKKWDEKDSKKKVRSKQKMRHSRIVKKKRSEKNKMLSATASTDNTIQPSDTNPNSTPIDKEHSSTTAQKRDEPSHKKRRVEVPANAALKRLLQTKGLGQAAKEYQRANPPRCLNESS